jgi:hypothetical protein
MGGRKRGSKNKKTLLAADELLLKLDINPIEKLIYIAESDDASVEQQIRCWQEIAKYTYPKLKSQEIYIEPEPVEPIPKLFVKASSSCSFLSCSDLFINPF